MVINVDSTCRICLRNRAKIHIFLRKNTRRSAKVPCHQMMNILFSFSTLEGDGLPTRICDSCHLALSAAYQLKELAEKSFRTLSVHLTTQLITGDRGVKVESGEPPLALKEEPDAEDEDFILLQVGNQSPAPEEKVGSPPTPPAPARLACPQCPKSFSSRSARYKHVSVHHLGKRYFCPICNKNYKNGYEHRRLAHSGTASRYPCTACGKTFPSPAKLRHHGLVHSALRPFPCPICPKGFRSRAECDYHRRGVHEKEKKFLCTFCPKGFFFIQNLKVHIRSHTKEKPFSCSHCGKLFTTLSQLSTHEQRHSGLKPVCCQVCGKDFVNTGALKMHILSHTQLREHTCRFCADTFLRLDHCRRHERTKHPHSLFSTSLAIES